LFASATVAKLFVLVAFVVVEKVVVRPPLSARAVVVALLGKRYENELPPEKLKQVLLTEKQPEARLIPLANVLVAVVEPTFNVETERPPANVEVAFVEVAR